MLINHKKKEILPFAATWVNLQGIIVSKTSQRKTNTLRFSLIYRIFFFKAKLTKIKIRNGDFHKMRSGVDGEMFVKVHRFSTIR